MASIDKRIAWVGFVLLVCFLLLFAQLNNIQVKSAKAIVGNPLLKTLPQTGASPFFEPRGEIISANGVVLAYSKHTNQPIKYQRVYPSATATMFSEITGYYANAVGADPYGVEASYNTYLEQHESPANSLGSLLDQHTETDNVYLTISTTLQAAAQTALNSSKVNIGGAVVVIDPRNGDILAMASSPTYDPNRLSRANGSKINALATQYISRPADDDPLINQAISNFQFPGSTFKVITTSAVFDRKPVHYSGNIAQQLFQPASSWAFPVSNCVESATNPCSIQNYGGEYCPSYPSGLSQILPQSCDSAYGEIGYELGIANMDAEARAFGFDSVPPIDMPDAIASVVSSEAQVGDSPGDMAYTAIGQLDDKATPLEMALVASAVADNGTIMAPHVVSKAVNSYGETEFTYQPHKWLQATSASTAAQVRQLMTGVTQDANGTATGEFLSWYQDGYPVIAAKTGTAEPTENTCATENWLIALGPAAAGQVPTVAVAAMVPVPASECYLVDNGPTGASVAGPVLVPVLEEALNLQKAGSIP
ncbi:MAG: penicillin-binding transpeptidase domain-containing protein [Acidimicrobiales bacterium]